MDVGRIGMKKHHLKALIEIDVTESRKAIKHIRNESGRKLSFTAWVVKCIGEAVHRHRQVHALRKGRSKLVMFHDVDISLLVEKMVDGDRVPIPLIIRNVNAIDITDISGEIEKAKEKPIAGEKDYVIESGGRKGAPKYFALLPQFIRLYIWKILLSNPYRVKKMMGTVVVTSVGMIGSLSGWLIPFSLHPVCFALGSVVKKPGVHDAAIEIREFLEMTILIDHDVIDGAPAARFVAELAEMMENGFGL
jgi:pyruvate/2-oxoglutarate dehydrogenase complex dihydrolipoamide acyltransferase (E2) component